MKIKITMKDPDGVYGSIGDAAEGSASHIEGVTADERVGIIERRRDEIDESLRPWIKYGEYVTLEFDTDKGTATVLKVAP